MEFAPTALSPPPAVRSPSLSTTSRLVAGAWTTPCRSGSPGYAAMDIGRDNGGVVDRLYESRKPFPFNGTVRKVVFDIKSHDKPEEAALHAVASRTAAGHALGE